MGLDSQQRDWKVILAKLPAFVSRLSTLRASQPEINAIALSHQIERMRTTLKRITRINKHLTALRQNANDIETEAETLKNELRDAIASIEDAMRE